MPGQRKYTAFILLTISVCVLAFYIHRHREGKTGYLDNIIISLVGKVQQQSFFVVRGAKSLVDRYVFLINAKTENEDLRKKVDALRSEVVRLREVELQNERLQAMLSFKERIRLPLLGANVIAHDVSADYFGIRIDKGSKDGVEIGMGVVSPGGVVGRVFRVTENFSDVLTLVDPTSNIDAVVQRSRARGIASGQANQVACRLRYIDKLEDVALHDAVVASGFGNVFPAGLLVGYVTSVIPDPNGVLQNVTVKSAVDIYRLEEVFVVATHEQPKKVSK